jgi:hypothetical protein
MSNVTCCIYCGRDTRHPSGICSRCVRGESLPRQHTKREPSPDLPPLEDDYSEESDANSVCDDRSDLGRDIGEAFRQGL